MTDFAKLRLGSPAGMSAELNANGSVRRLECKGLMVSLFVGNEIEGGPANLYLRRRSSAVGRSHAEPSAVDPPDVHPSDVDPSDVAQGAKIEWTPLLGPSSPTRFEAQPANGAIVGRGEWLGIEYSIALVLAQNATAWFWHVQLKNTSSTAQTLDLTYAQDLALAPYGAVRLNEFYVSQYLDHTPLNHPKNGVVTATRQNQAVDGRNPWCLIGSLRKGVSFATDALQFHGLATRAGAAPVAMLSDLPNKRLQHEHSLAVIRDEAFRLDANSSIDCGFFGGYRETHPEATSSADAERASEVLALPEAKLGYVLSRPAIEGFRNETNPTTKAATLFSAAPLLKAHDLDDGALRAAFPSQWRHEERDKQGTRLSFFHSTNSHVVLRAKELRVQRPHGHLLRTGLHLTPDESALTSTAWMSGVFHSMVTQGHVSINRFLSTVHTYISLFRSHGQRVFVEIGGKWHLLDMPSAFEMSPDACLWIYRHDAGEIRVRAEAHHDPQEFTLSIEVTAGAPMRCLISHHSAMNGDDGSTPGAALWKRAGDDIAVTAAADSDVGRRFPNGSFRIAPLTSTTFQQVGGDELLFLDGRWRAEPFICVVTAPARSVGLRIRGDLIAEDTQRPLRVGTNEALIPTLSIAAATSAQPSATPARTSATPETAAQTAAAQLARLADIAPWFTQNAFVHYLSPRGLEQYSGGGWGARDVCQGPVEMLLALDRVPPIRDLLLRVMSTQNPDGDWPQWFMFFERERGIRPGDSHGDIVFWPLLVLGQYLIASGDGAVLDESVRFFDGRSVDAGELATVWQHAQRALGVTERRVIPGTSLAAYGHGDWNDSLQPADPRMRDHLCSAWTVTLHVQTLKTLAQGLRAVGRPNDAAPLDVRAHIVKEDFQRLLVADGVLTGYALFEDGGHVRHLLHPSDTTTGVRYSALAMIHAILEDMLTPEQTREHLHLIETKMSGPDGVRLFDRPMHYHGGPQRLFQRAESATFFGREIGLMYTHAHLRFAQALAHVGDAERFFHALCQANPIGIRSVVPSGTLRQANCYYSSSDAAFADRYQASEEYERVADGTIALDGGWRVYSSGAGIALGLIVRRFLGLSVESDALSIDPVIPASLNGLSVSTTLLGRPANVRYQIREPGCGVTAITLNEKVLSFTRGANPHRLGAARVAKSAITTLLAADQNILTIEVG